MATRTTNLLMRSSLVCGMLLAASPLMADTWTDPASGITWTYTVTGGKASVGGGSLGNPAVPTSTQGAIVVPTAIGGKPVTEVGNSAFEDSCGLTSVTIPDSVTSIGWYAFADCSSLSRVVMMGSCPEVDNSAFARISPSCVVRLPAGNATYAIVDGKWQGMIVEDYLAPYVWIDGAKGTIEKVGGVYFVAASEGMTLTEYDLTFGRVPKEAYVVTLAPDGKSAISAKPEPAAGESIGALPVQTYEGLTYQVAWGNDLADMTTGAEVAGTGGTLYLGVVKQTGRSGFYKVSVRETQGDL